MPGMSKAKLVCNQARKPKATATSTPIATRCSWNPLHRVNPTLLAGKKEHIRFRHLPALGIDARQCLGERHPIGEILNMMGILRKLTCFKMTNATKPALPAFELVHVVVHQSGIRNQHCRCHQKLAAAAGYFCPISIRLLQGRRN